MRLIDKMNQSLDRFPVASRRSHKVDWEEGHVFG